MTSRKNIQVSLFGLPEKYLDFEIIDMIDIENAVIINHIDLIKLYFTYYKVDDPVWLEDLFYLYITKCKQRTGEVIQLLVDQGLNINAQIFVRENTALMMAIIQRDLNLILTLLEMGADPNIFNSVGLTALYYACKVSFSEDVIIYLLDFGANPEMMTIEGGWLLAELIRREDIQLLIYMFDNGFVNINAYIQFIHRSADRPNGRYISGYNPERLIELIENDEMRELLEFYYFVLPESQRQNN